MTIVLKYITEDGTKEQVEFMDNTREIDLDSKHIVSIDLSPLASCSNLIYFNLSGNQLQNINLSPITNCTSLGILDLSGNQLLSIDLSPLASCSNLWFFDLSENQLQSIDLSPLVSCSSLKRLYLLGNQLQNIDLSPLTSCYSLWSLGLAENQLQSIDLSPLASCSNLKRLTLAGNKLQSLDLTPLTNCSSLKKLNLSWNPFHSIDLSPLIFCTNLGSYPHSFPKDEGILHSWFNMKFFHGGYFKVVFKRPVASYPWSFLYKVSEEFEEDHRVQQDILLAIGLRHYGFIDGDLRELFLSVPPDTPLESVCEQVQAGIIEEIVTAVDREGATTGLRIEGLLTKHSELARNAHQIIETRKTEMERVCVGVRDKKVNLRELYLTAYGYEILTTLDMRLTTDLKGLEQVRTALSELGFELKTGKTSISGVRMSDELKQVIWWIVENRCRLWKEISDSYDTESLQQ